MDPGALDAQIAELRAYLAELRGEPKPAVPALWFLLAVSAMATGLGLRAQLRGSRGTAAEGLRLLAVPHAALLLGVLGNIQKAT